MAAHLLHLDPLAQRLRQLPTRTVAPPERTGKWSAPQRRLVAILAADRVGYSRMMALQIFSWDFAS